ncbi:hypothetical protein D7D94_03145 [Microbacterium oryzae]|uniref:Uncharacterized protein n=1 Tax=Microbacterium oryzae TaxID=743009 RepID=A0A6I6DVD9_9MICO|nr:hypothetical protein D7D94_03145 [Microbacterium oryzae]
MVTLVGELGVELGQTISETELATIAEDMGTDIYQAHTVPPLSATSAATTPSWKIVNQWKDNKAKSVYLRYRNETSWGWAKARDKHGVTQNMIKKTVQFPRKRVQQGTSFVYMTPANQYVCTVGICRVTKTMDMKVVHETKSAKGVITAMCNGVVVCPKWVRDAAA